MTMPTSTIDEFLSGCTCPDCARQPVTSSGDSTAMWSTEEVTLPNSYNAATSNDARWITNGIYQFFSAEVGMPNGNDSEDSVVVSLHTVQSGSLAGQRILRRMNNDNGRWEGFATLQADGGVWIWNRSAALRGTPIHRLINQQFMTMHQQNNVRLFSSYRTIIINNRRVNLSSPSCNGCNRAVSSLGAYCPTCNLSAPIDVQTSESEWMVQLHTGRTATAPSTASYNSRPVARPRTRPAAPRVRRNQRSTPLMSEIDPTQIQ